MHPTDLILFQRLKRGDPAAFETVIAAHYESVFRQQYLLCRDHDFAADLTQETFVEAWRSLPRFGFRASVRTWLFRIAVRVWQQRSTQVARTTTVPMELIEESQTNSDSPETLALDTLQAESIACALGRLPPDVRAVLVLHYHQGLTLRETASALDLPVGTVKSRLNDGLRRLRRTLVLEEK